MTKSVNRSRYNRWHGRLRIVAAATILASGSAHAEQRESDVWEFFRGNDFNGFVLVRIECGLDGKGSIAFPQIVEIQPAQCSRAGDTVSVKVTVGDTVVENAPYYELTTDGERATSVYIDPQSGDTSPPDIGKRKGTLGRTAEQIRTSSAVEAKPNGPAPSSSASAESSGSTTSSTIDPPAPNFKVDEPAVGASSSDLWKRKSVDACIIAAEEVKLQRPQDDRANATKAFGIGCDRINWLFSRSYPPRLLRCERKDEFAAKLRLRLVAEGLGGYQAYGEAAWDAWKENVGCTPKR